MTPMTEKQLERALREAAGRGVGGADLERARRGLLAGAEDDGLLDVAYTELDSPFGKMLVAGTERGLVRVAWPHREWDSLLEEIAEVISPRILEAPGRLDEARRQLDAYFEGGLHRFDLPLDWRLTHGFQGKAIRQIARIPYGKTLTYRELATRAGNPRAFRAAGTACGANPLPPIVPCHRVLPSSGGVGSYGGGPEMKRALLELEGAIEPN
ncbi:MAG: methylated-DNA--[protein]-cysteine S-methyltransferase [Solirubrobacterales bacterium]